MNESTAPTVLLVDDQPFLLETLAPMLEAFGYGVLTAESGARALAHMETTRVHLLLTDVRMPEMDGLELADLLQARHPHLPVLFMSGYADEQPRLGPGRRFLAKPFTVQVLIHTVDTLLQRRPVRFAPRR
jgi:CheY-like chemotaxis protein